MESARHGASIHTGGGLWPRRIRKCRARQICVLPRWQQGTRYDSNGFSDAHQAATDGWID